MIPDTEAAYILRLQSVLVCAREVVALVPEGQCRWADRTRREIARHDAITGYQRTHVTVAR